MKNTLLLIIAIAVSGLAFSQVAIGKQSISSTSVSLEFGNENRGMILPWVTNEAAVASVVNGTMVYDASVKKVKVKYASGWTDLSVDATGTTTDPLTNVDGLLLQNSLSDNPNAKAVIGADGASNTTAGILVLSDTNKAMILPKVAKPYDNIINPAPGMMVYDTTAKQLALFNGKVWSFWKP